MIGNPLAGKGISMSNVPKRAVSMGQEIREIVEAQLGDLK
jgi:hypothetical protein